MKIVDTPDDRGMVAKVPAKQMLLGSYLLDIKWITLAFITALAISCGGGDSGGSDGNPDPAFRYNGETGQAVITENNAEQLVTGCYSSLQTGSTTKLSPSASKDGDVDIGWNVQVFNLIRSLDTWT